MSSPIGLLALATVIIVVENILYLIQQRYELAEPLLWEAHRTSAQALGKDSVSSKEIKRLMSDLYKNLIPNQETRIVLQKLKASALVSTSAIK